MESSTRECVQRWLVVLVCVCWLVPVCAVARPVAPEDAVYLYDVFRGTPGCADLAERLSSQPLRSTVILSVEQGPDFLLDRPDGEALLDCALRNIRKSSRTAKALFLQAPEFLKQPQEAVRRAALLGDFSSRYPGLLAGVQVNIEPYVTTGWNKASRAERRRILASLASLLGELREPLLGLPLGLAVGWWYQAVAAELPEAAPSAWLRVADEVYVMAYGDKGGPLVGGSAERVLARVDPDSFFSGAGRVHLAVAAYEFRSPQHLDRELTSLRHRLTPYPAFAGTAVFHAASPFDVPLVRIVAGTVKDHRNRRLAGVVVRAGKLRTRTDESGQFYLRGLRGTRAELLISRPGFGTRSLKVELAAPGRELDLGKITLRPETKVVSAATIPAAE